MTVFESCEPARIGQSRMKRVDSDRCYTLFSQRFNNSIVQTADSPVGYIYPFCLTSDNSAVEVILPGFRVPAGTGPMNDNHTFRAGA
jgi:hypothetical protein